MSRIWVLGAPDPEMAAIERLLTEAGEAVVHAAVDGRRVHPGNAYAAALPEPITADTIYEVECMIVDRSTLRAPRCVTIDHHRPGDPGYGRPPADFLPASSIGQVIAELARLGVQLFGPMGSCDYCPIADGVEYAVIDWYEDERDNGEGWIVSNGGRWCWLPDDLVLVAAADHCLAAAYNGECPGVNPDALMRWRAESRAAFQRRPAADLLADVERARKALRSAPELLGIAGVRDLRGQTVPELPEAAARDGVCFVSSVSDRDGRIKVVCQSGSQEQIAAFMRVWAPANGLTDIYGDPARGFAGGYMP